MDDNLARSPSPSTSASRKRLLVERIRQILGNKSLTIYTLAALSRLRHPHEPRYHLPHNFYFQLEASDWTPTLHQLATLAELSGYRIGDWLKLFGFHWDNIARVQAFLARPRTALLDPRIHEANQRIPWFRDRHPSSGSAVAAPLSLLLLPTEPVPVPCPPFTKDSSHFLYAKIGSQDALAFPDLAAGSIVRADARLAARYSRLAAQKDPKQIFLIEHGGGVCCTRLHFGARQRITVLPTQLPFAHVEFELGSQARILGLVDLEFRPLLHPKRTTNPVCAVPEVAPELARVWSPQALDETVRAGPPPRLLRRARLLAGLSLRSASAMSRDIAKTLGDRRYFISQGSLSDYEANDQPPRHIHKIFTLAILYVLPLPQLLHSYAVDLAAAADSIPLASMEHENTGTRSPGKFSQHGLLSDSLEWLGEVPFFLNGSIGPLSGLSDLSLHDVFWVANQPKPWHPLLAGARLAFLNRRKTTPPAYLRKSVWDRPLYLLLRRNGSYLLASCTLEGDTIVAHPCGNGYMPSERLRNRIDAEVIGQVVAVVRSLDTPT